MSVPEQHAPRLFGGLFETTLYTVPAKGRCPGLRVACFLRLVPCVRPTLSPSPSPPFLLWEFEEPRNCWNPRDAPSNTKMRSVRARVMLNCIVKAYSLDVLQSLYGCGCRYSRQHQQPTHRQLFLSSLKIPDSRAEPKFKIQFRARCGLTRRPSEAPQKRNTPKRPTAAIQNTKYKISIPTYAPLSHVSFVYNC